MDSINPEEIRENASENLIELLENPLDRESRVSINKLLYSSSCYRKSGETEASRLLHQIIIELLSQAKAEDEKWLSGLVEEWKGDSYFIVGELDKAIDSYQEAEEVYSRMPQTEQDSWGQKEEFDWAYFAFQDTLKHTAGTELEKNDEGRPLELDFEARIKQKITEVEKLKEN